LQQVSGITITDFDSLFEAYQNRVDYFHANGCRVSDHGFTALPYNYERNTHLDSKFSEYIAERGKNTFRDPDNFRGVVLAELCKMYHAKGWVQQFHLGAQRNNNTRLIKLLGADVGADSIGDYHQTTPLARLLDLLDSADSLAKTVLYNLNPADNEAFATMAGNYCQGPEPGKVQFGAAWWFLDQKDGMERQLNALSSLGSLSTFIGMLTDSRSFLSFSRHEYFRRILCNLLGSEMERGELPNDEKWIGKLVSDICYYNARRYFNDFK
ncbi:MAG: glucuronate isomerase, partial [Bacteroidota bacterium]